MRRFLVLPLLLAACTTVTDATQPPTITTDTGPAAETFAPPTDLAPVGAAVDAVVTRVLDGDSMEVVIDGSSDEIRLLGINAPERGECLGDESRTAMIDAVEGKQVVLHGSERDRFGRLLTYLEVDGSPVGWLQVRRGMAIALTVDHPRLGAYGRAEDDAFIDEIGIWALDACGPPADAILGIDEVVWDPPGPDGDNRNGEYVRLINDGAPVDMTGWVLRDESSSWRYHFPDGFSLADAVTVRTGCGNDDTSTLYWCADDPLWSNFGDTALVLDPSGNVVARVSYGAKTER
jgi:endonuclease YncB( thermonuclease family)